MNITANSTSASPTDNFTNQQQPTALRVLYALQGVLGVLGNLLVCVVFIKIKKFRKSLTNVFLLNQSVIDLTTSLLFMVLIVFAPSPAVIPDNTAGDVLCSVWLSEYTLWALFIASTANLTVISLERYLAVCHPVYHRNKITRTKVKVVIGVVWVIGFVRETYWPPRNYSQGGSCHIKEFPNPGVEKLVGAFLFATEYVLPLGIMTFAYGNIIVELKRRTQQTQQIGPRLVRVQPARAPASASAPALATPRQSERPERDADAATPAPGGLLAPELPSQGSASTSAINHGGLVPPSINPGRARQRGESTFAKARRNVTNTMLIVSITFIICWSPASISYFVANLGADFYYDGIVYFATLVMVYTNMCVNPFIYAFRYKEFRSGLKQVFGCRSTNLDPIPQAVAPQGNRRLNVPV